MKTLTVFTPTYNRKHTLPRTYESLCRQTCRDFDWLIIDDGSSDGTREWIESLGPKVATSGQKFDWMGRVENEELSSMRNEELGVRNDHFFIEAPNLCIEYIYKPNGGLYTGYNVAYQTIQTELCVCIDSDDYMPDDAVEKIVKKWSGLNVEERNMYCGLVGLDLNIATNEPIGGKFPDDINVCYFPDIAHVGDTKPVFRTALMTEIAPMIGFEGERDFNPHYMQMQVYDKYPALIMNEVLCCVEYQIGADSMSQGIFKQYVRSPRSYAKYRLMEMQMQHGMTWKRQLMLHVHYVSSCISSRDGRWLKMSPNKLLTLLLSPVAVFWTVIVIQKATKNLLG